MTDGAYGELTVLVDGRVVVESGWATVLGILPSTKKIVEAVRRAAAEGDP